MTEMCSKKRERKTTTDLSFFFPWLSCMETLPILCAQLFSGRKLQISEL